MFPVMKVYSKGTAFSPFDATKYGHISLGNLGYSSVQCAIVPLALDKLALQCPYGKISKLSERGVGVNPKTS
jgi:hypothetical protein